MNPQTVIAIAIFCLGLACGWSPTRMHYEAKEDQRAKVEAEAALEQEKKNVAIVTHYQDLLSGVSDWYRANPVRVRVQGREASAACPAPNAADILLTVGGVQGRDRGATDSRLFGDHGTDAKPDPMGKIK